MQTLAVPVALSGGQTINAAAGNVVISQPVSGSGAGLTLVGNGTLTMSGANTYTGNTTISAGTLALSGSGSIASANLSVATGAKFDVSAIAVHFIRPAAFIGFRRGGTQGTDARCQNIFDTDWVQTKGAQLDSASGAPVSDPAGIEKRPETRRIGDRRSTTPVGSGASRCTQTKTFCRGGLDICAKDGP